MLFQLCVLLPLVRRLPLVDHTAASNEHCAYIMQGQRASYELLVEYLADLV